MNEGLPGAAEQVNAVTHAYSLAPAFTVQEITPGGCSLLLCAAQRNQLDLLFSQLDLELIAWLEVEHGGVGLAHHEIAVELDLGGVAQLAATLASTPASAISAEVHPLSI